MGIDERHFNFMTILINQTQDGGSPFDTTPSTVRGNLSNMTNPTIIRWAILDFLKRTTRV